jgi:hypothetical protein
MARKVGPSSLDRRVPVHDKTSRINGICEGEEWFAHPCQHFWDLCIEWKCKIDAGVCAQRPNEEDRRVMKRAGRKMQPSVGRQKIYVGSLLVIQVL